MAIANGTCVSFCNQPKAHFGLPLVRPWDNRGKCQWMKRGLNACQKHRSMHPSVFNRFPVIQPVTSKVRYFSTFLHILAYPGYAPGTIAVCYMDGKMIQCWSNAWQHIPIYLQPFTSYDILVGNCNFSYPLHLTPPLGVLGCFRWNSGKRFGPQKTRITALPGSRTKQSQLAT